jgi:hypothetical protein
VFRRRLSELKDSAAIMFLDDFLYGAVSRPAEASQPVCREEEQGQCPRRPGVCPTESVTYKNRKNYVKLVGIPCPDQLECPFNASRHDAECLQAREGFRTSDRPLIKGTGHR